MVCHRVRISAENAGQPFHLAISDCLRDKVLGFYFYGMLPLPRQLVVVAILAPPKPVVLAIVVPQLLAVLLAILPHVDKILLSGAHGYEIKIRHSIILSMWTLLLKRKLLFALCAS
jgi:hypothetical protein